MVKATVCIVSLFFVIGCATYDSTPMSPEDFVYQLVIETGKSQKDGYVHALNWIADTYGSAKAVIEISEPESGLIIGKAWRRAEHSSGLLPAIQLHYTMKIEIRENRARIMIYDLEAQVSSTSRHQYAHEVGAFENLRRYVDPVLNDFQAYMKRKIQDW